MEYFPIRLLFRLRLRLMFPATVQPEVLLRGQPNQLFQARRESLRDRLHCVGLVGVFARLNHVLNDDLIASVEPRHTDHHHRHVVLQSHQCDCLMRRGGTSEKVHE